MCARLQGCAGLSSGANLIEVQMSSGFSLRCELHFVNTAQHLDILYCRKNPQKNLFKMYSLVSLPHHQCLLLILHLADGQKAHCIKQQDIIYTDV